MRFRKAKIDPATKAAKIVSQYGSNALSQTYIKSGVNQALEDSAPGGISALDGGGME